MNQSSNPPGFPSRTEMLVSRARRAHQRGERRQALVALREAALLAETDAKLWALYGFACAKAGRLDEAERAFGQAFVSTPTDSTTQGARNTLRDVIARLGVGRAA